MFAFQFQTPYQFLFLHHNVQHLLVVWEKEQKKEIYLVDQISPDRMELLHPGESYQEQVLDEVGEFFFSQLELQKERISVILAATFEWKKKLYATFYQKEKLQEELYFFEIQDRALTEIPDEIYEEVVIFFQKHHQEYFA
ncbi:hypothetical protein [Risungbinella massiliensis]|uniref:hypothetical protein n=1 Tax=Risungbinella massiliensis TaxID=1329796 RepID=UPI0005CC5684|nr:hypothetical protein [Risungbinella massiliensis]